MARPDLLYRKSFDGKFLYLRVPDKDTEYDTVLKFNRVMADYGFPNPKDTFNERLGVAVFPAKISYRVKDRLVRATLFEELQAHFNLLPIPSKDWYETRF